MTDPRIKVLFTADEIAALGRCPECGWHPPKQGHHPECADYDPDDEKG